MCQIVIDKVESDTLQQATRLTALVSGRCNHGGEVYLRALWNDGQMGPESTAIQVGPQFHQLPVTWTAHNLPDRLAGVRVVCRCKATSVYQEAEI
ncbi:MAG: hypothetical protein HZA24_07055 [Nitrospirae bacterium]|nr:hypothetical protein [Nitrospirota bacterium]